MARRKIPGARAIVTGASSGIGREIARELARQRAEVLVTARREERLRELVAEFGVIGTRTAFVAGDITQREVRRAVLQEARSLWGGVDVLVNNAGVGAIGPFMDADEARLRHIMEVNFFAPLAMIREALPLLRNGRRPIIANVGSVLGHRAVPRKSEYCASKFALHGFSDALRAELRSLHVDVLLISPSTTRSEFFESVLEKQSPPANSSTNGMPASAVARKAVRAIRRGSHEIILSPGGKLLVWLDRLCPPLANYLIARFA
jgi:short-subunit dehydrogenase